LLINFWFTRLQANKAAIKAIHLSGKGKRHRSTLQYFKTRVQQKYISFFLPLLLLLELCGIVSQQLQ
jgi:hypothetical protein